jgi:hypothetical protein
MIQTLPAAATATAVALLQRLRAAQQAALRIGGCACKTQPARRQDTQCQRLSERLDETPINPVAVAIARPDWGSVQCFGVRQVLST